MYFYQYQMDKPIIYTIGHSDHQLDFFMELIQTATVNCIIDVRSVPASAYAPQFNQEPLKNFLKHCQVTYLHFAEEFGAKQTGSDLLDSEGILDFEKVRNTECFPRSRV